jgi:hypothetical protein
LKKEEEIITWTYAVDGSKYTSSPKVARLAYASISSVGTANCTETMIERWIEIFEAQPVTVSAG